MREVLYNETPIQRDRQGPKNDFAKQK